MDLKRLHANDAQAVMAFELANRAYFSAFISDRGDEYFHEFADRFDDSLAEQDTGSCAYYLSVDERGTVLGRFNLYDLDGGVANLGYRVAERAAGRGLATAAVWQLCQLAEAQHGLHTLWAATSHDNVASQRVLAKAGFVPVGPAEPTDIGGKSGTWHQRRLSPTPTYR